MNYTKLLSLLRDPRWVATSSRLAEGAFTVTVRRPGGGDQYFRGWGGPRGIDLAVDPSLFVGDRLRLSREVDVVRVAEALRLLVPRAVAHPLVRDLAGSFESISVVNPAARVVAFSTQVLVFDGQALVGRVCLVDRVVHRFAGDHVKDVLHWVTPGDGVRLAIDSPIDLTRARDAEELVGVDVVPRRPSSSTARQGKTWED